MEKVTWSLPQLLELSGGYWSTCVLHAGVKLNVFTHLAGEPLTGGQLAVKVDCDTRGLTMLLNALAALDLLDKSGEEFVATPFAAVPRCVSFWKRRTSF